MFSHNAVSGGNCGWFASVSKRSCLNNQRRDATLNKWRTHKGEIHAVFT